MCISDIGIEVFSELQMIDRLRPRLCEILNVSLHLILDYSQDFIHSFIHSFISHSIDLYRCGTSHVYI